jgi:hypothetical protein
MTKDAILLAVEESRANGISVIAPREDGSKAPDVRKGEGLHSVGATPSSDDRIAQWYGGGERTGIGWATGTVSGCLTCIDFDTEEAWANYRALAIQSGLGDLLDRVVNGYCENTPRGAHLFYRCESVEHSRAVASKDLTADQRKAGQKSGLIDIKGEGGYVIVAPTFGAVNLGGSYVLMSGGPSKIITISAEEQKDLIDLALYFDEKPREKYSTPGGSAVFSDRPGDLYNRSGTSWRQILEPHGWVCWKESEGVGYWRRPGKTCGNSGTTNNAGLDLFHCFTDGDPRLPEGKSLTRFAAYGLLVHGGDFTAAASDLAEQGYDEDPLQVVDISKIAAAHPAEVPPKFPPELLECPGLVGGIAKWINDSSVKPQPVLALGASLAAVSALVGQKIQSPERLRTNIYSLGIAESGSGKERARQAISQLFVDAGAGDRAAVDEVTSDSAILAAIGATQSSLFLLDELGLFLRLVGSPKASPHLQNIESILLKLYGLSSGTFQKQYANAKNNVVIDQPHLSIYATTVPRNFFQSLTSDAVSGGLLGRFSLFFSEDPNPERVQVPFDAFDPPRALVDQCRAWEAQPYNRKPGNMGDDRRIHPIVMRLSDDARAVFSDADAQSRRIERDVLADGGDPAIFRRVEATAIKFAMIRAAGRFQPQVGIGDAEWAAQLALYQTGRMHWEVTRHVADNATESNLQRVEAVLAKHGKITMGELGLQTRWLKTRDRREVLSALAETGIIEVGTEKNGKGRPITWIVWRGKVNAVH